MKSKKNSSSKVKREKLATSAKPVESKTAKSNLRAWVLLIPLACIGLFFLFGNPASNIQRPPSPPKPKLTKIPFGSGWPILPPVTPPKFGPLRTETVPKYDGPIPTAVNPSTGNVFQTDPIYSILRSRLDLALSLVSDNPYAKSVLNDLAFEGITIAFSTAISNDAGSSFRVFVYPDGTKKPTITLSVLDFLNPINSAEATGFILHELYHYHHWKEVTDDSLRQTFEGGGIAVGGKLSDKACRFLYESELQAYREEGKAEASMGLVNKLTKYIDSEPDLRRIVFNMAGAKLIKQQPECLIPWAEAAGFPEPSRLLLPN